MSSMLSAPPSGTVTAERSVPSSSRVRGLLAVAEVRWAVVATVLFTLGGVAQLAGGPVWLWWALYLSCYATGGWGPALAGLRAAREKSLDVDLLMIVAAIVAAAIGQVFDGALLIVSSRPRGRWRRWPPNGPRTRCGPCWIWPRNGPRA